MITEPIYDVNGKQIHLPAPEERKRARVTQRLAVRRAREAYKRQKEQQEGDATDTLLERLEAAMKRFMRGPFGTLQW